MTDIESLAVSTLLANLDQLTRQQNFTMLVPYIVVVQVKMNYDSYVDVAGLSWLKVL